MFGDKADGGAERDKWALTTQFVSSPSHGGELILLLIWTCASDADVTCGCTAGLVMTAQHRRPRGRWQSSAHQEGRGGGESSFQTCNFWRPGLRLCARGNTREAADGGGVRRASDLLSQDGKTHLSMKEKKKTLSTFEETKQTARVPDIWAGRYQSEPPTSFFAHETWESAANCQNNDSLWEEPSVCLISSKIPTYFTLFKCLN